MSLFRYNKKRNFEKTSEPVGKNMSHEKELKFVVQKHDASHLHYDLRLEMNGVMKSWAVPKGPSINPRDKRLAIQVEDHPISYNSFEGHIPKGQYGGGDVIVWDKGTYHSLIHSTLQDTEKEFMSGLKKGEIKFFLKGKKLKGIFSLFYFKNKNQWLLIKNKDEHSSTTVDVTNDPSSVLSNKKLIGKRENKKKYLTNLDNK